MYDPHIRYGMHITDREREILRPYVLDDSKADIAARLGLSFHTVHRHLAHAYVKLGMSSKLQLLSWAMREGLVTAADVKTIVPKARYHG